MKALILALAVGLTMLFTGPANAKIFGFLCDEENVLFRDQLYITVYDDGTPARIGTQWGIGNKALVYADPLNDAWVVVELNTDGLPDTLTTIMPDGRAIHSRHTIDVFGLVLVPSQTEISCRRVDF
ncbi:MAG: hypothetical protein HQ495_10220 [Alphaproteobacteria bacterium]|nr:hypothetical protein [Alphaproteobacteria bacterium]